MGTVGSIFELLKEKSQLSENIFYSENIFQKQDKNFSRYNKILFQMQ